MEKLWRKGGCTNPLYIACWQLNTTLPLRVVPRSVGIRHRSESSDPRSSPQSATVAHLAVRLRPAS